MGKAWALHDRAQLHKGANRVLDQNLAPDETVRVIIRGIQDSAFIGTERRLFVFKKVLWDQKMSTWDYSGISGVEYQDKGPLMPAFVRANAVGTDEKRSYASDNALQISFLDKTSAATGVAELRRLIQSATATVTPSPAASADYIDEIKRLAALMEAGILSVEEFEAKKRRLLEP